MSRRKQVAQIFLAAGLAALLATPPAQAYYHYVHYLTRGAPFTPVFEKFDLNALANKTVTFLVLDSGPTTYAVNDDFPAVLSQVKQAAAAWNSVDSSDLRVAFGGLEAANQVSNTPGGDVIFIDLPPGLLGMGAPTASTTVVNGPSGAFFPVVRSTVMLTNDTSKAPGPSYLEKFYTTAVHEMGHALGLQHTFTASAMSQGVIRNTSHARPLDADDIAGLSTLYGKPGYAASTGSISGRVTSNGQGVALASVVALTQTGPAISTLTNPDGTYRIEGLPPNQQYQVYVHPLPPDADIKGPFDANGQPIPSSGPFETLFYPGTRDVQQFGTVPVTAGAGPAAINFSVQPRNAVPMYDMVTYSYSGQLSWTPAFVNTALGPSATIVAQANFPLTTPIPQSVTVFGIGNARIRPYGSPVALALDLNVPGSAASGPRHILFNTGNDMYVLPDGLTLVQKNPPAITGVTPNADGTVTVAGSSFGADSRVFFDGLPVSVQTPLTGDARQGSITVTPPPGYSGQVASVTVFNSDGQNSTIYQQQNPPTFVYPSSAAPQTNVSPSALPAGVSAMVDITGVNMQFVDGQVTVGFGSDDVTVRRLWVLSPSHLIADVAVAPGAAIGASEISVISGFQTTVQPLAFQTQAGNPSLPSIALPLVNADASQQSLYPGAVVSLFGTNLATGSYSQVLLNDQPVPLLFVSGNQVNFVIPPGIATGPTVLKLNNGTNTAFPIMIQIDKEPPVVASVTNAVNQVLDIAHPGAIGDILTVTLASADASLAGSSGRIHVTVSGVELPVLSVAAGAQPGTIQVFAAIVQSFGGSSVPLSVTVDGSHSNPYSVTVR